MFQLAKTQMKCVLRNEDREYLKIGEGISKYETVDIRHEGGRSQKIGDDKPGLSNS